MPFQKCKIYSDGSHYIAIPYIPRKRRLKKGVKVKEETPVLEELDVEDEICPFDEPTQLTIFDSSKKAENEGNGAENIAQEEVLKEPEPEVICDDNQAEITPVVSKKELFEQLYQKHLTKARKLRKQAIIEEIRPYFKTDEDTELFVELNFMRKLRNLITRRIRMTRKANLQTFNYFVTFTYSDALHTEESFRKKLKNCLSLYSSRKRWKYIGVWERSPEKKRLHFHGVFDIPDGTMPGCFIQKEDYSFKTHRRQITNQDTYFLENFGRNDFEKIEDKHRVGQAIAYLMKYMEKSGERLVYSKGLPQFFLSDIMEDDIVCPYGIEDRKLLLFDDFSCWDEGEYIGQVSKETIAKMPKAS